MPRIFDNIDLPLLGALKDTLQVSSRSDFCVGYFNLRGWGSVDRLVERWPGGEGNCCRLLVGMQRSPDEELRVALRLTDAGGQIDNQTALRIKRALAEHFRDQLMMGFPTNEDEAGLRRLAAQIKAMKLVVELFMRHPLHAKLYLLFRSDPNNPIIGFLGSSNLTMSGLASQGELNVDVLDHDATEKLARWFEDRWQILRDWVVLHTIEHGRPSPIGSQDSAMLDARLDDVDNELPRQSPDYSRKRLGPRVLRCREGCCSGTLW